MSISQERLAEIAAIADEDIDTSEISEADATWFKGAKLVIPQKRRTTAKPVNDLETPNTDVNPSIPIPSASR